MSSPYAAAIDDATATARTGTLPLRTSRPAHRFSVLPQQAPCPSPTGSGTWLVRAHGFPQHVCIRYACRRSGRRTGQCSLAHTDIAQLDCHRLALSCQAMFWPPIGFGNALEQTLRLASPHRPPRGTAVSTGAAALCPGRYFLSPRNPLSGALRIAYRCWRSAAVPLLPRVLCGRSSLLASVWNVMPQGSCVKAWPRSAHQQDGYRGLTTSEGRTRRTRRAAVLADRSRRRVRVPGTGGARVCRTRRGRGLADRAGATCPPTPRRSLRSVVARMVFHWPGCVPRLGGCGRLPMAGEASRMGAARGPLPWPASGRCGFPSWEGHAR